MNLIKLWKSKGQILEGIKNSVFKDEHVEEIAAERKAICDRCPHIDNKGDSCMVPVTYPCCSKCGCSLAFKTRSLSSECPEKYWGAILTEEEDDLLNEELNK